MLMGMRLRGSGAGVLMLTCVVAFPAVVRRVENSPLTSAL